MNSEINQTKPLNNGRTSRRKFLMRGGIILGGTTIALAFAKNPGRRALAHFLETGDQFSFLTSKKLSFWFEVDDENTIILKSAKAEMGQGIFTGFALIAAEELNISPDKIKVVSHNTKTDVNDILGTNASSSTLVMFDPIRKVAALFRETFTHTAARYWGCSPTAIVNEDAHIQWQNKKLSFAQLLDLIDDWKIPRQPKLKPKSEYKYIGQEVNRFDLAEKVMGTAKYAIDHHIEGMLYAQFISCPYIDGTIVSIDKEDCLGIKDVLDVVWEEDLIAVVAKTRHAALLGKRKLNIEYTIDRDWQQRDIEMIVSSPDVKGRIIQKKGKMSVFSRASDNFIKASYFTPIGVHSQIEPNGLVADVKKDSAEIFIGYQWTYLISHQLSKALGIKRKNISIQNHFIGGGFGRKFFMAKAVHTAKLSQRLGRPICSFWEREDEFQHGYFRPNSAHNLSAALNPDGTIHSFSHSAAIADMVFHNLPFPLLEKLLGSDMLGSGHGIRTLYNAQNIKAVHYDVKVPYKVGIWRGVGMFPNNFAQESFIDELAHEAGIDPATFRLMNLEPKNKRLRRLRNILKLLIASENWSEKHALKEGWGLAIGEDRNTVVAAMVKVAIVNGLIVVQQIIQAIDPGLIINPEGVKMQVEGASIMAMSAALYEEALIEDNQFIAKNFDRYKIARMEDSPSIKVHLYEGLEKPYGVGEAGMAPIAPALSNAVFNLTGKRLRRLPLQKAYELHVE